MNVLSLFDGISCGKVALDRAGIHIKKYYASEIDKYAIKISEANHPDIIRLGDVTKWKEWAIDWSSIDLLIGGFPCQAFSFAGKQQAFRDPRGRLFFTFVDILNHIKKLNPNIKFLIENTPMAQKNINIINRYLGVKPVLINSDLVSGQDRKRLYWASWHIEQPADKKIILSDVLEKNINSDDLEKAICGAGWHEWWSKNSEFQQNKKYSQICNVVQKAITLTARMYASWNGNFIKLDDGSFRRLTPVECERLQTLEDGYTAHVSNSQRYKALGNGWTVDVIAHIFSTMSVEKQIQERLFA